jgi:hypothetical protein
MIRSLGYAIATLVMTGVAWAEPGGDPTAALTIVQPPEGRTCGARSGVCLYASRPTIAVEGASAPVAARKSAAAPVTQFARGDKSGPWLVELQATLKHAAVAGNALFVIFDEEDPHAVENHEYTAMYQTSIHSGRALDAKFAFHPDEGFRAGHTYRVRVAQLIGGKELVLTEAELTLK